MLLASLELWNSTCSLSHASLRTHASIVQGGDTAKVEEDIILADAADPEQLDVSEVPRTGIRMALRRSGGHVLAISSYVVLAFSVATSFDFSNRLCENPRTKMKKKAAQSGFFNI